MANKLYEENDIKDIANALREKNGEDVKYKVSEMGNAVRGIVDTSFWRMYDGLMSYEKRLASFPKLKHVPYIDTSLGTNFKEMFAYSDSLISISNMDTSNATTMFCMFNGCKSLVSIPILDISKVTNGSSLFYGCESLVSIPELNPAHTGLASAFGKCYSLVNITFVAGTIYMNQTFSDSPLLSDASTQSIIDGLADLTDQTAQTLTLHADVKAKLTETQIATITSKNWTLA